MASTWERLWLGSRARQVRPRVRWAFTGVWTIFLIVDVLVLIVGEKDVTTGVLLAVAASLGIAAQIIPLAIHQRHSKPPPDR